MVEIKTTRECIENIKEALTMQIFHINCKNRSSFIDIVKPGVAALGFFDGVHLGHQKVIRTAVEVAKERNIQSIVMTFSSHPKEILGKEKIDYLTSIETKKELLKKLGVDVLYLIEFNFEFASLAPNKFVQEYLIDFNIQHVVAGFDFTYGYKGEGNMQTIVSDGLGSFQATVVDKINFKNQKISSTRIRTMIQNGNILELYNVLGDYYQTVGTVNKVSSKVNVVEILVNEQILLPPEGKYKVQVEIAECLLPGIIFRTKSGSNTLYLKVDNMFPISKAHQNITVKWLDVLSTSNLKAI